MAERGRVLQVPDYEDLSRCAQAARAAAMAALIRHMLSEVGAALDRLRDRVASAVGGRAFSGQS